MNIGRCCLPETESTRSISLSFSFNQTQCIHKVRQEKCWKRWIRNERLEEKPPLSPQRPCEADHKKRTRRSAKLCALAICYEKIVVFDRSSPVDEVIRGKDVMARQRRKGGWWQIERESKVGSGRKGWRDMTGRNSIGAVRAGRRSPPAKTQGVDYAVTAVTRSVRLLYMTRLGSGVGGRY